MGCFKKTVVRVGVIGALIAGAGIVLAHSPRGRAIMHQAGHSINAKIDRAITDPVALRIQLRDLESKYPERIEAVRSDLQELKAQQAQLKREQEVNERVVALADTDLDKLNSALAQAEHAVTQNVALADGQSQQIVICFKQDRLPVDAAYNRVNEITNTRNAYSARSADIERDLGYLAQQEDRLSALLNKLDTERQQFQAQLWELDRQVDAVARNDRMIQIMQKRQRTIDEQSRYNAGSLDQITAHLADIKAKQEAKLAGLTADQQRTNYEDAAKIDLDREQSAKKIKDARFTPTRTKVKPSIIEIRPDPAPAAKPGEAASGKTDSLVGR
jgi:uncharacterized phage infection (PIP) family protein YhgE